MESGIRPYWITVDDYDTDPDVLAGDGGNDLIYAAYGDRVDGGADTDTLVLDLGFADAGVVVNFAQLTDGGAIKVGGATLQDIEHISAVGLTDHSDRVVAGAAEPGESTNIFGRGGDDTLFGTDSGGDFLSGDDGEDVLRGLGGDDTLNGGRDGDIMDGGDGNDLLFGIGRDGTVDMLTGDAGADHFSFNVYLDAGAPLEPTDRVTDFSRLEGDIIGVDQIDAIWTNASFTDAFTFIGTSEFHDVAGELRYEIIGRNTFVLGDATGDGSAELIIRLDGRIELVESDFVL